MVQKTVKTYMVTGGAGFIGSNLCQRLLQDGHRVICVDNLATGHQRNIDQLTKNQNFQFIHQDISEKFTVKEHLDGIYDMASPASPVDFERLGVEILKVNSFGVYNLLELAKQYDCFLLFASTSEVYGDPKVHPQPEDYWGNVNPNGVRSCYDESKRFAESLILNYTRTHGIKYAIVRIFNTYGPNMRANDGRVVSNFINQALRGEPITIYGEGLQTRCFCYVDDLVEGIIKAARALHPTPINLGSDHEMTVAELANRVLAITQSKSSLVKHPLPKDDPHLRKPHLDRARKILQWQAEIPLEEGLRRTVDYFRAPVRPG